MKILHSADWHLDSPLTGLPPAAAARVRQELLSLPGQLADLCRREGCDMVLLAGDLFDGKPSRESLEAVCAALERMAVPVFIAPGNHDFCTVDSPYLGEAWPENVHIFKNPRMESVSIPELECRVWGAGYDSMDCPPLLEDFRAEGTERWAVGVLHGDPTRTSSPCCPVASAQVTESALDYLALGHIHRGDSFRAGQTLCAWPGCPAGRGWDEPGAKGVLIAELGETASVRFVPLEGIRFYVNQADAGGDPAAALESVLPPARSEDFFRVSLTGYAEPFDSAALAAKFPRILNLEIQDKTRPMADLWGDMSADNLEGTFFRLLKADAEAGNEAAILAAEYARRILDGQEVVLP